MHDRRRLLKSLENPALSYVLLGAFVDFTNLRFVCVKEIQAILRVFMAERN